MYTTASPKSGRPALTRYRTEEAFEQMSFVRVIIETGRTHQIRVHMSHIGHPIVGDRQYGRARANKLPVPVKRQMLHAEVLAFSHPRTGEEMRFVAPVPEDMQELVRALRGE